MEYNYYLIYAKKLIINPESRTFCPEDIVNDAFLKVGDLSKRALMEKEIRNALFEEIHYSKSHSTLIDNGCLNSKAPTSKYCKECGENVPISGFYSRKMEFGRIAYDDLCRKHQNRLKYLRTMSNPDRKAAKREASKRYYYRNKEKISHRNSAYKQIKRKEQKDKLADDRILYSILFLGNRFLKVV